jgi:serine phosphatase RsbU (regulator of sigma subunit)
MKFETKNEVVNRGGKRFIAKDGVIEVTGEDVKILEEAGFKAIKEPKETKEPKEIKDEDNKKGS